MHKGILESLLENIELPREQRLKFLAVFARFAVNTLFCSVVTCQVIWKNQKVHSMSLIFVKSVFSVYNAASSNFWRQA